MRAPTLRLLLAPLLALMLGLGAQPVLAVTTDPIDGGARAPGLRPSAAALPTVAPLVEANFRALLHTTVLQLRREAPSHLEAAALEGVEISTRQYERALEELAGAQLLTDDAWSEQMQGAWSRCALTDACTARFKDGRGARTLIFVRSSAVPYATDREVHASQLHELLAHELAHVLLIEIGFTGNQDAFITSRWTLGARDSALAAHLACAPSTKPC